MSSRHYSYDREIWTLTFAWDKQCGQSCSGDEIVLVYELTPTEMLIYRLHDMSNTQLLVHCIFSLYTNVHIMISRNMTQSSACSKCAMQITKDVQRASFLHMIPDGYHVKAKTKVSWNEASKICRNWGLWLPKITDKENQIKINNLLNSNEMQLIYFMNYRATDQVGVKTSAS